MNKALFLDRDGVINVEVDYLYEIDKFIFIDGILDLCRYYQQNGYIIIVVTNQSGIARGYYSEAQYHMLTDWMIKEFANNGITITRVYHCPHHPDISGVCECRKPNPQMLLDAKDDFDIDMSQSLLIGDKERDIEAALNAGLSETYLFDENSCVSSSKASRIVDKLDDIWKV